jgi:hypothetical protein
MGNGYFFLKYEFYQIPYLQGTIEAGKKRNHSINKREAKEYEVF